MPRLRDHLAVAVVVLMLTAACEGGTGVVHSPAPDARRAGSPLGGAPLAPCAPGAPVPADATDLFGPGQRVDSAISSSLGVTRARIGVPAEVAVPEADKATTLPWFAALQRSALDAPSWDRATVSDVTAGARAECARAHGDVLVTAIAALAARTDSAATGTTTPAEPIPDLDAGLDPTHPLRAAFGAVFAVDHPWPGRVVAPPLGNVEPAVDALAAQLGPESERAVARVVLGMARAEQWRLLAARPWYIDRPDYAEISRLFDSGPGAPGAPGGDHGGMGAGPGASDGMAGAEHGLSPAQARSFDVTTMARAGAALAWAVERLGAWLRDNPMPADIDFHVSTPLGEIVVSGTPSNDVWQLGAPALIVDQRGNDVYRGCAGGPANASIPLSAVVDLSGDDHYESGDADHTQGTGVFSFGFLVDMSGNDVYNGRDDAQGAGLLGVGAVLDAAGNDTYSARYDAQGAGQFGIGLAVDLGGDDRWTFTSEGQGLGGTRGSGALVDADGNDVYVADDATLINPSAQSGQHNLSDAQGMGTGMRGDRTSAMAGGVGVLADLAGNDSYSCGVFCQGAGYWFAHGILYDASGDDSYRAAWYGQGAAAHFAIGTLVDNAGDDVYSPGIQMADGAGHDRSLGFFIDGGGNDRSTVRTLSHGAGNDVGFGFYVDVAGDDIYVTDPLDRGDGGWYGQSMVDGGFADEKRAAGALGLGFFLDSAGADDYQAAPAGVANGASWKLAPFGPGAPVGHLGLGIDSAG